MSQEKSVVLVVVPLRVGSTRLKQKIRADIGGLSLAQRTVGRALDIYRNQPRVQVVAAVDDESTERHLHGAFPNLKVVMTDPEIPSGTDRVSIAAGKVLKELERAGTSVTGIVNLQGDIPFVGADGLLNVADYFLENNEEQLQSFGMVTLAQDWPSDQDYVDRAAVKVLSDRNGFALYFSRQPIPHSKIDAASAKKSGALVGDLHIGVYGYTPAVLAEICAHAPIPLELAEGLEQLRAQWLGLPILVMKTETAEGESYRGIDTSGDLKWAKSFAKNGTRGSGKANAPSSLPKSSTSKSKSKGKR